MENDEIKIEDVEDVLGQKIYWKIPNNYFTIMSAIKQRDSCRLVNPESKYLSKLTGSLQQCFLTTFNKQQAIKKISREAVV